MAAANPDKPAASSSSGSTRTATDSLTAAANPDRPVASSSGSTRTATDSRVCVICWSEISDPRLLLCLHSYCRTCIDQLAVTGQRTEDGRTIISCPVCRSSSKLPLGLASDLPKDVTRLTAGGGVCVNCQESGGDGEVVSWCKPCRLAFCKDHAMPHLTATGHDIKSLSTPATNKDGEEDGQKYEFCAEHDDDPKDIYCGECKMAVCGKCVAVGDHSAHQPRELLSDVRRRRKAAIMEKVRVIRTDVLPQWQNDLRTLRENSKQLAVRANEAREKIRMATERAVEMIDACAQQKQKELDDIKEERMSVLTQQRDELQNHVTGIKTAIAFSKRLKECPCTDETLKLVAALDKRVSALREKELETKPKRHPRVGFIPVTEEERMRRAKNMLGTVKECKA